MSITAKQLSEHYALLSDDELEAMDANELTDVARSCYDSEMKRRGLAAPESSLDDVEDEDHRAPFEVEEDGHQDGGEPFVVSTFDDVPGSSSVADAEEAYRALSAAGIPCQVRAKEPEPDPPGTVYFPQREIIVRSSLALRANSVLDKAIYNPKQESEWKTHLASLTDNQLLSITVDDICSGLLDRAERLRKSYMAERSRRNL